MQALKIFKNEYYQAVYQLGYVVRWRRYATIALDFS